MPQCDTEPGDPSRHRTIQIVSKTKAQREDIVKGGDAICLFLCRNRIINSDQMKAQGQEVETGLPRPFVGGDSQGRWDR